METAHCVHLSLSHFFTLSFGTVQFHYQTPPKTVLIADDSTRIRGFQDHNGDIILGGLFPLHTFVPGSDGGECEDGILTKGIQTLEAMLYTIDAINSDPDLLPNITLGYDIRDTCQSEKIGLDESADMVLANDSECCFGNSPLPGVMAVIGPLQSDVSIPIASFFRIFQMPQVSYASSSSKLNNRNNYRYFFRTFPPTNSQVQAVMDIIVHYKWDHISVIFSHNLYGESLANRLRHLAKVNKMCLDFVEPIYNEFTQSDYLKVAKELMTSYAKVVVLFTIDDTPSNWDNTLLPHNDCVPHKTFTSCVRSSKDWFMVLHLTDPVCIVCEVGSNFSHLYARKNLSC